MSFVTQKCYQAKPLEVERKWYSVDADGRILGRMAVRIATVLMGKNKPTYTPHVDTGDFVVVTNAEKVRVTGRKDEEYSYAHYTYHHDGLNVTPYKHMMKKHPDRIITQAVKRMLPKNALGRRLLTKLKVYAGSEHPHQAQQCEPLSFETR
ncbi:MAG TPA: 50S ribosomal protein L13 [Phycisphaerae bacterium]|nr:50S ribosomal protein L13 [Phycisphaerae bacterium]